MSGYYRMYRGWMDNKVFASEPFSRAQAWEWMISEAAWKDRTITIGFSEHELVRGQLCKSVRVLAENWKWDVAKVFRFLSRLENENMITTDTETSVKRITICNYEKYQDAEDGSETPIETPVKQPRNTDETTIEEGYKKDKKETIRARGSSRGTRMAADWWPNDEDVAFAESLGLPESLVNEFVDFWLGVPGQRGIKLDWSATWRNNCRAKADRLGLSRRASQPSLTLVRTTGNPNRIATDSNGLARWRG